MIIRIKNAIAIKSSKVYVLHTFSTLSISKLLKNEGFIESFTTGFFIENNMYLRLKLKYQGNKKIPLIRFLCRVSSPSFRVYTNSFNIPKVFGGAGVAVLLCLTCLF